jgi:hypothetical protein
MPVVTLESLCRPANVRSRDPVALDESLFAASPDVSIPNSIGSIAMRTHGSFQPEIEVPANKNVWHGGGSRTG